jgi:sugar O-acyltransferase (sialic acid O-acetyltransferase NeuD family)
MPATDPVPHADRPWCLVGSGGHARAVADVLRTLPGVVGCVADAEGQWRDETVLRVGTEAEALSWAGRAGAWVVVAIGDNQARRRIVDRAVALGLGLPPVIAASATVSSLAVLGPGVVVMEHAHVGPGAEIGSGVLVNTAAVVEHDCRVGPGTHLAPGSVLLGHARVGATCLVGARSTVLVGCVVGDDAVLGAGSVATRDLPGGATYVGGPARPTRPAHP